MTTTVRVLIEGNKACEVMVEGEGEGVSTGTIVQPGQFVVVTIHGKQQLTVKELTVKETVG